MSKDKNLEWIEKSGGYEWTPGSPWPPEVPDEEADSGDTYTVAFDHLMNNVKHSDYYYDTLEMIQTEKTHSLIQRTERGHSK